MAQKKSGSSEKTTVHRITAKDDAPVKKATPAQKKEEAKPVKKREKQQTATVADAVVPSKNPFVRFGQYVKGAWHELKQVRWPTRSATWSMTVAVLLFSAAFVVFITLLDAGFNWLFELILN